MANAPTIVKDKNPLRVYGDTATGTHTILDDDTEAIAIQKIIWTGFSTAAHIAQLTSGDQTHVIWKAAADAPGTNGTPTIQSDFNPPLRCFGLRVNDLDSGELFIYKEMK